MNLRLEVAVKPLSVFASLNAMRPSRVRALLCVGAGLVAVGLALAQTPPSRVRGDIVSVSAGGFQLKADSGQTLSVRFADRYSISARSHSDRTKITPGVFLGATTIPGPDGSLVATEVHIFPETMRGTGEGHRPMDPAAGTTMTDATVASVVPSPSSGRTMTNATVAAVAGDQEPRMTLKYKGGEKVVSIPKDTPIVMVEAGDASLLVPGAHVIVSGTRQNDGSLLAERVTVGKDGLIPPL